jgi:uncharacterized membrane protein
MGGFTLLVPRDRIEHIDLPIEKAISLALTAWIKADPKQAKDIMENRP